MKSKYQIGWIGIRVQKAGKSARIFKNQGWIKLNSHADTNNRNGFDYIRCAVDGNYFKTYDFKPFKEAGLQGLAIWFSDAQWKYNSGFTDKQWQNRRIIEI